jgi:hypothetical protein
MTKYIIMVLLLLVPSTYEAYALVTMMINLEDEDEGEYSLSSIEIEESKNPNDLNTLCNYVSGCTYEFGEGGDNEFRYNTFDPSKRVLEGTLEMSYDTKGGGTETHFFDMRATLDISSVSTNEDGSTQEYYLGDIQFQPKDILDSLIAGGEKIAFGNANFTDDEGILKLQAF